MVEPEFFSIKGNTFRLCRSTEGRWFAESAAPHCCRVALLPSRRALVDFLADEALSDDAAPESDEEWQARVLAEARDAILSIRRTGKPGHIFGSRLIDRISDPTLSIRAVEAEAGNRVALQTLCRVYREAKKAKRLGEMPFYARVYVEAQIAGNGGKIPKAIGGRPKAPHRAFALAVAVEVERKSGGTVSRAIDEVTARAQIACRSTRETVEQAHKRWRNTAQMRLEMAYRCKSALHSESGNLSPVDLKALAEMEPLALPKPPRPKIR